MKKFLFLLSFSLLFANCSTAPKEFYPQIAFNSKDALNRLDKGKSTIEGTAFTKPKNGYGIKAPLGKKIYPAQGTIIELYPVTEYFTEWHELRKKKESKTTKVYMSEEAYKHRITTSITDNNGHFKFTEMKPGKYFIQAIIGYTTTHSYNRFEYSSGYTNYYSRQSYNVNTNDRVEEFVEITRDGQLIEFKLR